jgi:hypothetical protein
MGNKTVGRNTRGFWTQITDLVNFLFHFFSLKETFDSKNNYLCFRNCFRRNAFIL